MKRILILFVALFFLSGCQFVDHIFENNETTNKNETILIDMNVSNGEMKESTDERIQTEIEEEQNSKEATETSKVEDKIQKKAESSNMISKIVKEGDLVKFKEHVAYDPDGDELQYKFSLPLNESGMWQTEIGDAGEYIVMVSVSDGKLESSQKFKIIVESINKKPVISNFEDITVNEGEIIILNPKVTDEDGDNVTGVFSGFMTSNKYKTTFDDEGTHTVTLTVTDGKETVTKTITIKVNNVNRAPKLSSIKDVIVTEGETVSVSAKATDEDGDKVRISFSKPLDETGTWETKEGDAGTYEIDVIARDDEDEDKETFKVIVNALNNPPAIKVASQIEVKEGETININPEVSDKDGDSLKITYSGFMTSSSYTTDYDEAGTYTTTITVSDGKTTVSKNITIVIDENNRPPVFVGDNFFE